MKREDALINFNEEYTNELLNKYEQIFYEDVIENKDLLRSTVMDSLKNICEDISDFQNELEYYKIKYFQFSILRTSIISESYIFLLSTYNQEWYLDDNAKHMELDMSFLFKSLKNLYNELYQKSKKFIGKINKYDIEKIILSQAMKYNEYIAYTVRFILQNIEKEEWFDKVKKTDIYFIRWGEYQDKSELVYIMDNNKKTMNDFIKVLGLTNEEAHKDELVYSVWKDTEISDVICIEKNMMFSNFKNSKISNLSFEKSILLGASFENAILQNVNFNKTNLVGVNFIGVKFEDVKFEEAILDGAIFNQEDVPFLHLSSSQLQVIYIKGD
ncbi:pentapeptide repeat-containing protein [Tepidibacter mesophilus]|uniref:pentapeptide repeat-containing protein n=1 Tax=Tepidibacter mesophilus TaxID=655607 RepID=UPI000C07BD79|nr:pentapeptide repeat-containing protein [Tepidibacter mesophilus]